MAKAAINLPIVSKFDNKGVKGAEGAFKGLGKSLVGIGAVVAGAFSIKAIADFSKEATLAAEAIQTSGARIDNIATSMGLFGTETDKVTARLKAFADQNEQAFAVDENVIMQAQATLLTFGEIAKTADEAGGAFDRATTAAIDLAAAGFGSAETNAIQLGKALNDPIKGLTALTRSGVTFTESEKELIKTMTESGNILGAQEMILGAIEAQVGGTAAATADASVRMGLAFGEIKEAVGAAILPAFEAFTAAVLPLIDILLPKIKAFLDENLTPALMGAADAFSAFIERIVAGESVGDIFAGMFQSIMAFFSEGGMEAAFEKLAEMRQGLIDAILTALPGVIDGLVELLPLLLDFVVGTMIPQMLAQFTYLVGELASLLGELMPTLIDAFAEIIPDLIQSLADLLPMLVTTVLAMVPTLLKTAIELFIALVDAVVEITPQLIDTIVELLPELVDSIVSMLPGILDAAIELFTAIVDSLPIILPVLLKAILDLMPKIIDSLISMMPTLIDGAFQLFTGLITALINMTPQLLTAVIGLIPQIVSTIIGAIPQLVRAGFEIVSGFARGIIQNAPRILGDAIRSMGNTLVNGVKSFLGIASPSKVFAGLGGDVVDGLKLGLDEGDKLIKGASFDMAQNLKVSAEGAFTANPPAPSTSVSAMASVPTSNVINLTVNAGMGADGSRIGQQIVDEILKYERSSGKVFARA
jgi:phage-related protein